MLPELLSLLLLLWWLRLHLLSLSLSYEGDVKSGLCHHCCYCCLTQA